MPCRPEKFPQKTLDQRGCFCQFSYSHENKGSVPEEFFFSLSELCVLILLPAGGWAQDVLLSERIVSAQAHQATLETVRQVTDANGQSNQWSLLP